MRIYNKNEKLLCKKRTKNYDIYERDADVFRLLEDRRLRRMSKSKLLSYEERQKLIASTAEKRMLLAKNFNYEFTKWLNKRFKEFRKSYDETTYDLYTDPDQLNTTLGNQLSELFYDNEHLASSAKKMLKKFLAKKSYWINEDEDFVLNGLKFPDYFTLELEKPEHETALAMPAAKDSTDRKIIDGGTKRKFKRYRFTSRKMRQSKNIKRRRY